MYSNQHQEKSKFAIVAIATGCVDRVLPREEIAGLLVSLVCEEKPLPKAPVSETKSVPTMLISPTLQDALKNLLDRAIAIHRKDMGCIHLFRGKAKGERSRKNL